ncbi:hypothetical protein MTBLM1_20133 [Rhodospirillaceae bacterium LM-1]|nr:hypothetical protein MTBLM1_20133 [Rhodospirillaceae bacterium LM-1]
MARLSRRFRFSKYRHWPGPRSLATTNGVSVDVLSSGYLDVSVRPVRLLHLCIQCKITLRWGFPIRKSMDQSLFAAPHGISQRTTSFIASLYQGIHQMPLKTLDFLTQGQAPLRKTQFHSLAKTRPTFLWSDKGDINPCPDHDKFGRCHITSSQ